MHMQLATSLVCVVQLPSRNSCNLRITKGKQRDSGRFPPLAC